MEEYKAPVISILEGRLGNCMFQIAAGLSYANELGRPYRIFCDDERQETTDFGYILNNFLRLYNIPADRLEWHEYESQEYVKIPFPPAEAENLPVLLFGYFEDERYFDRDEIMELFKPPVGLKEKIFKKYGDLTDCVSISVRCGDFVDVGMFLPPEWYENAYNTHFSGKTAYITSDDIDWCRENIKIPGAIFAENNTPIEDLYSCSFCKDHITYDGTFGWWGAYLGEKEDSKIVIKKRHFNSLPDKWIQFE